MPPCQMAVPLRLSAALRVPTSKQPRPIPDRDEVGLLRRAGVGAAPICWLATGAAPAQCGSSAMKAQGLLDEAAAPLTGVRGVRFEDSASALLGAALWGTAWGTVLSAVCCAWFAGS